MRSLAKDAVLRRSRGEYVCDGAKLLADALAANVTITSVLAAEGSRLPGLPPETAVYTAPPELVSYASPLENSPGPVFTAAIKDGGGGKIRSAVVLEGVQDPGNVGTVIRTASALGIDAVVLTGNCADPYGAKAVRATMGAIFRERVIEANIEDLKSILKAHQLKLFGAALAEDAEDILKTDLEGAAVAIGSEGRGLSENMLALCGKKIMIPMQPGSDSLNAAVAASIVMWELSRKRKAGA